MDTSKMPSAFIPDPSKIPPPPQQAYSIPALPEHRVTMAEIKPKIINDQKNQKELKPDKANNIPTAFIERNYSVIMQIRNALNGVVEVDLF